MTKQNKSASSTGNPTDPFGFADMFKDMFKVYDPQKLSEMYDPKKLSEMFDPQKFLSQMPGVSSEGMDVEAVMKKNRESFEAMVEANKAAAATYQDMLQKQMDIFNRMTAAAQDAAKGLSSPVSSDAAENNVKVYSDAAEKAFQLMREMAEAAKDANQETFERLSGQVKAAMEDLKKS